MQEMKLPRKTHKKKNPDEQKESKRQTGKWGGGDDLATKRGFLSFPFSGFWKERERVGMAGEVEAFKAGANPSKAPPGYMQIHYT